MTLDLTIDAATFLADFGEDVIYTPRDGRPRTITAVVDRNPPSAIPEVVGAAGGGLAQRFVISVANDELTGIAPDRLDTGGDAVHIAPRIGEALEEFRIAGIVSQDPGMIQLEVR